MLSYSTILLTALSKYDQDGPMQFVHVHTGALVQRLLHLLAPKRPKEKSNSLDFISEHEKKTKYL